MTDTTDASQEEAGGSMLPPPRENLVRDVADSVRVRDSDDGMPVMSLRYVPFEEWTEIRSDWEGNFLERVSPGATLKTISENRDRLKIQFDHGKHPSIGSMLLGTLEDIREERDGGWADVRLFDTSYNHDLLPGLRAGAYGASFRFRVVREDFEKRPGKSAHNPRGIPERTIQEMRLEELGPVTWPAYAGTKVGVRSATDEYIARQLFSDSERMRSYAAAIAESDADAAREMLDFCRFYVENHSAPELRISATKRLAPSADTPPVEAPVKPERRDTPTKKFKSNEEWLQWIESI